MPRFMPPFLMKLMSNVLLQVIPGAKDIIESAKNTSPTNEGSGYTFAVLVLSILLLVLFWVVNHLYRQTILLQKAKDEALKSLNDSRDIVVKEKEEIIRESSTSLTRILEHNKETLDRMLTSIDRLHRISDSIDVKEQLRELKEDIKELKRNTN